MVSACRSAAEPCWFDSHAESWARALSIATPGLSRPTTSSADAVFLAAVARPELRQQRQWRPEVGRAHFEAAESLRHDADDLERQAVDDHGASQHVRIAIEAAGPPLVAQHNHRVAARSLVIRRSERPPQDAPDADDLEEISRDERDCHHLSVNAQVDVVQRRIGIGEDAGLLSKGLKLRTRQERSIAIGPRPFDAVHRADVGHCVNPEQEPVQDREEDGHDTKTDRDGDHDRDGGKRPAPESAHRVLNVSDRVVDEGGAALVAACIGSYRRRSKPGLRRVAGSSRRHALVDQLLRFTLDVEGELVVQVALDAAWHDECPQAMCPVAEVHGLRKPHHALDGVRHSLPFARFNGELTAAGRREPVILGPAAELRHLPLGFEPALKLEPVQGRVERALVDLQHVFGNRLDALRDCPAVQGVLLQRAQDQQVERAGQQIWGSSHDVGSRH